MCNRFKLQSTVASAKKISSAMHMHHSARPPLDRFDTTSDYNMECELCLLFTYLLLVLPPSSYPFHMCHMSISDGTEYHVPSSYPSDMLYCIPMSIVYVCKVFALVSIRVARGAFSTHHCVLENAMISDIAKIMIPGILNTTST
jgi:hypothetical protein